MFITSQLCCCRFIVENKPTPFQLSTVWHATAAAINLCFTVSFSYKLQLHPPLWVNFLFSPPPAGGGRWLPILSLLRRFHHVKKESFLSAAAFMSHEAKMEAICWLLQTFFFLIGISCCTVWGLDFIGCNYTLTWICFELISNLFSLLVHYDWHFFVNCHIINKLNCVCAVVWVWTISN